MRQVNEYVSQWACGRYFFCWGGDEILLYATNDADAIAEGEALWKELACNTLLAAALCLLAACAAQHTQLTPQDVQELTAQWEHEALPDLLATKK
jgi:hypothetical protein